MSSPAPSFVVDQLREQIRRLQAAPRTYVTHLRTGVAPLDALLPGGGFPLGHAVELCGESASGRTSIALRTVAAAHRELRLCAWVDGPGELYAPAASVLGVDLSRLLIARPAQTRQLAWTAVQLARSGAFSCVVLDLTRTGVRLQSTEAKRLGDAAFRGGSLVLMLTPPEAPSEGGLRMSTQACGPEGLDVELLRSRHGGVGQRVRVPWAALYPQESPEYDEVAPADWVAPTLPSGQRGGSPFVRVKRSDVRNGCGGVTGQRPGRDMAMPSLGAALGLSSTPHH